MQIILAARVYGASERASADILMLLQSCFSPSFFFFFFFFFFVFFLLFFFVLYIYISRERERERRDEKAEETCKIFSTFVRSLRPSQTHTPHDNNRYIHHLVVVLVLVLVLVLAYLFDCVVVASSEQIMRTFYEGVASKLVICIYGFAWISFYY